MNVKRMSVKGLQILTSWKQSNTIHISVILSIKSTLFMTACQCKMSSIHRGSIQWGVSTSTILRWQPSGSTKQPPTTASASGSWWLPNKCLRKVWNVYKVHNSPCILLTLFRKRELHKWLLTFCCWNCSFSFWACFFRELFSCWRLSTCNKATTLCQYCVLVER